MNQYIVICMCGTTWTTRTAGRLAGHTERVRACAACDASLIVADPAPTDRPIPDGDAVTDFYRRVVEWRTCLDSDGAWTLLDDALSLLGVDPDALVPTEFLPPAADPAPTDCTHIDPSPPPV